VKSLSKYLFKQEETLFVNSLFLPREITVDRDHQLKGRQLLFLINTRLPFSRIFDDTNGPANLVFEELKGGDRCMTVTLRPPQAHMPAHIQSDKCRGIMTL
jgi:hypothetical protein